MIDVDAVICDLDDTLIVEESAAMRSLAATVATLPDHVPGADDAERVLAAIREVWWNGPAVDVCRSLGIASWEGLWATCDGGHPVLDDVAAWIPTYRRAAWARVADAFGATGGDVADLEATYIGLQRQAHRPVDGAVAALDQLAATHRLALLTNGPPDIQRHKVVAAGLSGRFTPVAISGELGVGKPAPAVYATVLEALGVAPHRALMVGDSWERDVEGARAAGLAAVWVSAGRPVPETADGIIAVIGAFPELARVLARG